jgi:hypothetical protein
MSAADETASIATKTQSWLASPFSSNMSAGGWFLFFGLVMVISVAWGLILKELKGEL